ncbi:multiple epidermal growth factor-like domains protein 9, partial [Aplysia californica]|uniref:Multiple epidermal growth factor-like domains protein 9 n=1 Tax=Aplysia californica TaxID=6500 RepID=A0ABM1A0K7_APLCA
MPLENITYCSQLAQNEVRPNRGACKDVEYSIMAALLNGAIACSCSGGAVTGSNCDPYSGDCDCLPGALPPKCDRCTADTYGYSATTGCLACGCDQRGSVSLTCSESGVCECRANVQGAKCNACLPQHYGLYTGSGCTPCQCVAEY